MNIIRLKKQAHFFIVCAVLAISAFLLCNLFSTLRYGLPTDSPEYLLLSLPASILTVLTILHAILLLRSIAMEDAPFTCKNVQHLKWIGWLFVAFEPTTYLMQAINNYYFPLRLDNGITMTTVNSYGGIFLIFGFVILSVATIFQYGMELQQLSDETL